MVAHPVGAALPGKVGGWEHQAFVLPDLVSALNRFERARGTFFLIPGGCRKQSSLLFLSSLIFFSKTL